jgi:hypothetical protein
MYLPVLSRGIANLSISWGPKLNPIAPPDRDPDSRSSGTSGPSAHTNESKWVRASIRTLAAIFGVGLAIGVGNLNGRMQLLVTRSPLTISATSFIRENLHPRLFEWEQELLAHLSLAPYFLAYAITFAFLLSPISQRGLLILPITYAVILVPLLLLSAGYFESMGLRWYHMIPTTIYVFCFVPITQIGINIAGHIRTTRVGGLSRSLAFLSVFCTAMLCIAFVPVKSLHPLLLLITLCALTFMTRKPICTVTDS